MILILKETVKKGEIVILNLEHVKKIMRGVWGDSRSYDMQAPGREVDPSCLPLGRDTAGPGRQSCPATLHTRGAKSAGHLTGRNPRSINGPSGNGEILAGPGAR